MNESVVTYDFDCTLTKPQWNKENGTWDEGDANNPKHVNHDYLRRMKKDAANGHRIFIVTSRSESEAGEVREFVKRHKLPVEEVIACDGKHKGPILKQLKSIRHHDDMPSMLEDPEHVWDGEWAKVPHPMDGKMFNDDMEIVDDPRGEMP